MTGHLVTEPSGVPHENPRPNQQQPGRQAQPIEIQTADVPHEARHQWARCTLCGLGQGRLRVGEAPRGRLCAGCTERLELEATQGLVGACPTCGRHPDLCAALPCSGRAVAQEEERSSSGFVHAGQPMAAGAAGGSDAGHPAPAQPTRVAWIPIGEISEIPDRYNARQGYDEGSIAELAASLREHGFLQPVGVRPAGAGYLLVFGQRRLRAARLAGLSEVPCTICVADDERAFLLSVVENLQRHQLSGKERVRAIEQLSATRLGVRELSRQTGFDPSTISRWLRIDRRPALRTALESDLLDVGRATVLVDAPEDALPSLLAEAPQLPQTALKQRVVQLRVLRNPTLAASAGSRRLTQALALLRLVRRPGSGDRRVLEQLSQEIDRLLADRAIA
jgi:ParB/RepB/Spo0J family partition protein